MTIVFYVIFLYKWLILSLEDKYGNRQILQTKYLPVMFHSFVLFVSFQHIADFHEREAENVLSGPLIGVFPAVVTQVDAASPYLILYSTFYKISVAGIKELLF